MPDAAKPARKRTSRKRAAKESEPAPVVDPLAEARDLAASARMYGAPVYLKACLQVLLALHDKG